MDEVRNHVEQIFPSRDDILLHLETSWAKRGKSLWQTSVWLEDPSKGSRRVLGEKEHASVEASQYLALAMAQSVSCKFQAEVVGGPAGSETSPSQASPPSQTQQEMRLVAKAGSTSHPQLPAASSHPQLPTASDASKDSLAQAMHPTPQAMVPQQPVPQQPVPSGSRSLGLREVFDFVDKDMDGLINKREMILACRTNKEVADFFGLPQTIRAEDGSRDHLEKLFQAIDFSNDRQLSWEEFVNFFGPGGRASDPGASSGSGRPLSDGQPQLANSAEVPEALARPSSAAGKAGALPKLGSQQGAEARPRSRAGSGSRSERSKADRKNSKRSSSVTTLSQMW
jgi:hypothetical protein